MIIILIIRIIILNIMIITCSLVDLTRKCCEQIDANTTNNNNDNDDNENTTNIDMIMIAIVITRLVIMIVILIIITIILRILIISRRISICTIISSLADLTRKCCEQIVSSPTCPAMQILRGLHYYRCITITYYYHLYHHYYHHYHYHFY